VQQGVWFASSRVGSDKTNELFTLGELNITEIATQTTGVTGTNQGHDLGLTSLFTRNDCTTGGATSIYFQQPDKFVVKTVSSTKPMFG
jgi:hypothetical protein